MLDPTHFRTFVVRPTLTAIGMHSTAAERLMLTAAIAESGLRFLVQIGGGPALGVMQIEPATLDDIWGRYLCRKRPDLRAKIERIMTPQPVEEQVVTNLAFAVAIARVRYWMVPQAMPAADDADAMGAYYKRHYNTALGKADPAHFADLYRRYALGS